MKRTHEMGASLFLVLLAVAMALAVLPGCTAAETVARGAATGTTYAVAEIVKAQWPGMKAEVLEAARAMVDNAAQAAITRAREIADGQAEVLMAKIETRAGVPLANYDANKDKALGITELMAWARQFEEEQKLAWQNYEARKEKGEDPGPMPIPWYERYAEMGMVALLSIFGAGQVKSAMDNRIGKAARVGFPAMVPTVAPSPTNGNGGAATSS